MIFAQSICDIRQSDYPHKPLLHILTSPFPYMKHFSFLCPSYRWHEICLRNMRHIHHLHLKSAASASWPFLSHFAPHIFPLLYLLRFEAPTTKHEIAYNLHDNSVYEYNILFHLYKLLTVIYMTTSSPSFAPAIFAPIFDIL